MLTHAGRSVPHLIAFLLLAAAGCWPLRLVVIFLPCIIITMTQYIYPWHDASCGGARRRHGTSRDDMLDLWRTSSIVRVYIIYRYICNTVMWYWWRSTIRGFLLLGGPVCPSACFILFLRRDLGLLFCGRWTRRSSAVK
ncbi:uncharacterized protein K489DRAFT_55125 [Dissoconium aciculare CBS 342.82]|uniref:Uncharacterized protein n=1 Tax=Dissoconium aciculare CBS 342.82 TaxID=1314786 RepID=A0A6J3LXJ9_9PEZI|nr:uncharacterized protein K489DRAFT_55125 [Dissoconium aciculare CBS 342.82]KAF1820398.1 hypothetical protein K489DRAFT_55125 [Dissoconium aciculare CBS 342.82]